MAGYGGQSGYVGQHREDYHSNVGATFIPGGNDDFYMPVVSPMPQRNMPEMPQNIAQNLAHLELEDRASSSLSGLQSPPPMNLQSSQHHFAHRQPSEYAPRSSPNGHPSPHMVMEDEPSFSPFPQIRDRPPNVPPTDEGKEHILEEAREAVLGSNDPEMQLAWAQDTLAFVEIAVQNEQRLSKVHAPRPQTPRVERQLRTAAVNVVNFLADQHHPKAEFLRGTWLEFGRFGHDIEKREAFRSYSRAAQSGYARAEYRMGMQFENSNEIDKAIRHYNLGIQNNDAASNYRMGMMTLLGQCGQRQDFVRGLDMIRYSAENADENAPQGAYVYGMLHSRELPGISIPDMYLPLNLDIARKEIEKAAYLGFARAQVKMGMAYELGDLKCAFDPILSLHYQNLAARQGEAEAEMAISKWFLSGYDGIFAKNEGMAFSYAQRAAADGLPTAEFAMGYFYEVGIHVPPSLKEARLWYSKAADHGNEDAAGRIDGISRSKTLSRKDHDRIALSKINSTRPPRYGGGAGRGGQQPEAEMPPIPSAADQYSQGGYGAPQTPYLNPPYNGRPPQNGRGNGAPVPFDRAYSTAPGESGPQYPGYGPPGRPAPSPAPMQAPMKSPGMPHPSNYGMPGPSPAPMQAPMQSPGMPHPSNYGRPGPSPAPMQAPMQSPGMPPPSSYSRPGISPAPIRSPMGGPSQYGPPSPGGLGGPGGPGPQRYPSNSPGHSPGYPPQVAGGIQHQVPGPQQYGPDPSRPLLSPGLGFSAPLDPSGADRRKMPSRTDNPNPQQGGRGGYGMPSGLPSARPGPNQNQSYSSNASSTPSVRPPRGDSKPQRPPTLGASTPSARPTPPPANNPPPPKKPAGPTPLAHAPQLQAAPKPAPPTKAPGKGPSTFDEMGVPQSKKGEDCVMM